MKKVGVFTFLVVLVLGFGLAAEAGIALSAKAGLNSENANGTYANTGLNPEARMRVMAQNGPLQENLGNGEQLRIQIREENMAQAREVQLMRVQNQIRIMAGNQSVNCSGECFYNESQGRAMIMQRLSNGANAEIKVMPDTAAERALERLRLHVCNESNNCTLQLKEVSAKGNVSLAYEIQRERRARVLGFIGANMDVKAQVDAETGEIIRVRKPWWAFLASEPQEE